MESSRNSSFYGFHVLCAILALHVALSSSSSVNSSEDHHLGGFFLLGGNDGGSELLGSEFEMESESNRRILAASSYISYGALMRDTVPCSRRGASYYNCRPGAPANPYHRGCSAITRCRG